MLRPAEMKDIERIEQIALAAFGPTSPMGGSVMASLGEGSQHVIVSDDDGVNGFLVYSLVVGEAEIYHIAVAEECRRQGKGEAMIKELLSIADVVHLDVRISNTPAIKLYEKCGFKPVYTRKNYYSNGENAMVMTAEGKKK